MADTLFLISQEPNDLIFATKAAETAGFTLAILPSSEEAVKLIQGGESPRAILLDATEMAYQQFQKEVEDKVGLLSEAVNPNIIHFISPSAIEQVQYLTRSPLFGNLILRKFHNAREEGEHYGRIIKATAIDRAFGLQNLMKPGTRIQTLKLVTSEQKQSAVDAIKNYIISAKFQTRIATLIANAIDEILMNAIFDAPVDAGGNQVYSGTLRSTAFKLENKAEVEMQVGFDGTYVGVTAIDNFGSLDKVRLLTHASKTYTDEEYKVKTSQAGAGIGIGTVYRTGGSFFFASESRVRTEATVFFRRTDNYRDFRDQFRFFSTQFYF